MIAIAWVTKLEWEVQVPTQDISKINTLTVQQFTYRVVSERAFFCGGGNFAKILQKIAEICKIRLLRAEISQNVSDKFLQ